VVTNATDTERNSAALPKHFLPKPRRLVLAKKIISNTNKKTTAKKLRNLGQSYTQGFSLTRPPLGD